MHPRVQDHRVHARRVIPNESELTAGVLIEPGKSYGFFTDTTVCIGCKACEVACKEWNNLPADNLGLTGTASTTPARCRPTPGATSPFIEQGRGLRRAERQAQRRSRAAG